ncbi:hypothetical protein NKCBBBOE_03711 [Pseudarthrobacter sp. MM222]|nr:hypothetical protein NKCBBBOE_03711 [Pseudarthrobacter sp. MM222]
MNNGLSKPLGLVLLAAAVFAAAGCTAPGSPNATPASSAAVASSESPTSGPLGPSSEPTDGAAGTAEPTDTAAPPAEAQAPGPQAAPIPTFAPVEQQYLASRVPEGTDPNAVLQVGQERCAELEAVKAVDQKAVVSQLIEKRDADVADVITGLCPGLQPELDAAGRGFTDGDYTIGDAAPKEGAGSISSGSYEAWNPSPTCLLTAFDAAGGTLAESNGTSTVTIPAGTARVVSDGCYTWLAA